MTEIIKTLLFRLKKTTYFWILLAIALLLPVFGALLIYLSLKMGEALNEPIEQLMNQMLAQYGGLSGLMSGFTSISSNPMILSIIFASVFLSAEFKSGTVRNAIIAGKSRSQLYLSYYLVALIGGFGIFVVYFLSAFVSMGLVFRFENATGNTVTELLYCFLLGLLAIVFVQTLVCAFLFNTRSRVLTIVIPLIICILGPGIIATIVETVSVKDIIANGYIDVYSLQYVPFYNTTLLAATKFSTANVLMIIAYYVVFSSAIFCASYFPFHKGDLK